MEQTVGDDGGVMRTQFGSIWEAIADAVPDQAAVVQGDRRLSWRDYEQRAARLAQALLDAGLGAGAKVGMYLYNSPEYCETNFAALKIRGIPINVNYRYLDNELALPARQRRRRGAGVPHVARPIGSLACGRELDRRAAADRGRRRPGARRHRPTSTARSPTSDLRPTTAPAARIEPRRRRRLHLLHRRHDRDAEGRDVPDARTSPSSSCARIRR